MSRTRTALAALAAAAMLLTACASTAPSAPSPAPATMKNGLLVNTPGMTLSYNGWSAQLKGTPMSGDTFMSRNWRT